MWHICRRLQGLQTFFSIHFLWRKGKSHLENIQTHCHPLFEERNPYEKGERAKSRFNFLIFLYRKKYPFLLTLEQTTALATSIVKYPLDHIQINGCAGFQHLPWSWMFLHLVLASKYRKEAIPEVSAESTSIALPPLLVAGLETTS